MPGCELTRFAPRVRAARTLGRSKIVLLEAPSASCPNPGKVGKSHFLLRVTAIHTRSLPAGTCECPSPRCPPAGTAVYSQLQPPPAGTCEHSQLIHTILVLAH
eukprot:scaffold34111_cov112-Isochrysis_galbana.AAC.3